MKPFFLDKYWLVFHPNSQWPTLIQAKTKEEAVCLVFDEQDLVDDNIGAHVIVQEIERITIKETHSVIIAEENFE